MTKRNPDPVVVGLVFVESEKIVVVRRSIPPFVGELALPGGYVNRGEDWRKALAREILEETNIVVSPKPEHMIVYDTHSTPEGDKMLTFAIVKQAGIKKIRDFKVNVEVSERIFAPLHYYASPDLCFPLHQKVVERYRNENHSHETAHVGGW